ncbi:unnamed protein product [Rotaria sp. Silwood2]|nr:unnamed protein product [Rotaria sp. Silwood2]CAF4515651.1 unnamed protein product [Rotaria sp. Silwood2]
MRENVGIERVNELNEFLNNGIWINFTDNKDWLNSYEWCDIEYKNNTFLWNDCISITKNYLNNKMNPSFCLSHVKCNEKLSYICQKLSTTENNVNNNNNRFFGLIGGLIGNLFGSKPQPPPPPPPPPEPIIIYHTNPPNIEAGQPLPRTYDYIILFCVFYYYYYIETSKSNNTILYVGIAVAVVLILIIILCCCFCGGFLLLKNDNSSTTAPRFHRRHNRTSVASNAILSSYNESCSNNFSCTYPLICSNTNKCVCPKLLSFWNDEQNDCLSCLSGWIQWKTNRCLSLAVPSNSGLSYNQANRICHQFSGQIFHIYNIDEFKQFELKVNTLLNSTFSSAVTLFFRLGAWINKLNRKQLENVLCDKNENNSNFECVLIKRNSLKNGTLCLTRLECNENMLFICDMAAMSVNYTINNETSTFSNRAIGAIIGGVAPLAIDLLGNLLTGNKPQPIYPPAPQQIIIQQGHSPSPQIAFQEKSLSDNTLLYILLGVGGFVLLLVMCGIIIVIIFSTGCLKNLLSTEHINDRSSIESSYNYG